MKEDQNPWSLLFDEVNPFCHVCTSEDIVFYPNSLIYKGPIDSDYLPKGKCELFTNGLVIKGEFNVLQEQNKLVVELPAIQRTLSIKRDCINETLFYDGTLLFAHSARPGCSTYISELSLEDDWLVQNQDLLMNCNVYQDRLELTSDTMIPEGLEKAIQTLPPAVKSVMVFDAVKTTEPTQLLNFMAVQMNSYRLNTKHKVGEDGSGRTKSLLEQLAIVKSIACLELRSIGDCTALQAISLYNLQELILESMDLSLWGKELSDVIRSQKELALLHVVNCSLDSLTVLEGSLNQCQEITVKKCTTTRIEIQRGSLQNCMQFSLLELSDLKTLTIHDSCFQSENESLTVLNLKGSLLQSN